MTETTTPTALEPPLSQHTIGPFFPATFFQDGDNDLTRLTRDAAPTTRGEPILIRGRVTREGGTPCVNAIIEAWQPDANGRFNHPDDPHHAEADPDFLGWGRVWTDADGRYEFRTVLPGGYADDNHRRAPHVNLTVMGAGLMRRWQTTVFFPDFPDDNAADPVLTVLPPALRPRLVMAEQDRDGGLRAFRFDIHLRGDDAETPCFED